jgi:XrtN system VIT domain protein
METITKSPNNIVVPKNTVKEIITNQATYLGYLLLGISFLLFLIEEYAVMPGRDNFTIFAMHYLIALVYVVVLLIDKSYGVRKSWREKHIHKTIILLNLFLISAFTLNRTIPVFADSTLWLCIYIVGTSLALLSYQYFTLLPVWANRLQQIVLGSAIVFYFYMTVFVAEYCLIGVAATILFGIGFHIFVPLLFLIASILLIYHTNRVRSASWLWIGAGSAVTVLAVLLFMGEWNKRVAKMDLANTQSVMYPETGLPSWVTIAESLENDWISERILKSDLVYVSYSIRSGQSFFPRRFSWDEPKKHDPLVFIASMIAKPNLSADERIKILETVFADRHNANERLWSGENLSTSQIISDIDIYPAFRLAYMEKYLNVKNSNIDQWWGNTQEAIYTFQLPEGSVVTSLSLWINGKEEKAILTSKQKATTAYKTIVGVEQRDPSVVHWQEGNIVTVRVFPCTPEEERKFKIGVTSPLIEKEGKLVVKNLTFKGPDAHRARETFRVRFLGEAKGIELSSDFTKDKNGDYVAMESYNPDFEVSFNSIPLQKSRFTHNGYVYRVQKHVPTEVPAEYKKIFLDINNSWTSHEVDVAESLIKWFPVYSYSDNGFVRLNEENWDEDVTRMRDLNFSLFPFHLISNPQESIVVTKGKPLSIQLDDVKGTRFSDTMLEHFAKGIKVKTYNLGDETSTYVRSLREFRALEFANGSIEEFDSILKRKVFLAFAESDRQLILHDAQLAITKDKITDADRLEKNNAPDHLARLFAYNNIMRKVGVDYFKEDFVNDELVDEASMAYVVSPVSSLIVLETKKDYERFGIADKDNSLLNASRHSTGSVPEPHEWALIILFISFVIYLKFRYTKVHRAI